MLREITLRFLDLGENLVFLNVSIKGHITLTFRVIRLGW